MPLELGIWLGARRFGTGQRKKACLILDAEKFRYQRFVSDIAGQDPTPHGDDPLQVVRAIRDWLQTIHPNRRLPGGDEYVRRFEAFLAIRPKLATDALLSVNKLNYMDRLNLIRDWLVIKVVGSITQADQSVSGTASVGGFTDDRRT